MSSLEETIVAVASPRGGAARGIVRMSGPGVLACLKSIFQPAGPRKPEDVDRPSAIAGSLRIDTLASPLPCELYFWPCMVRQDAPYKTRSYTGEPLAELHTLGCSPLLDLLVERLCDAGARLAQPGEFTLRAFLSGRIDLTQAEAVLGVIEAHDQRQLDTALTQLAGGLARPLAELREMLIDLLSHLEAGFDFADEDLPFITPAELRERLAAAAEITSQLSKQIPARASGDAEPRVVLAGRPNTGKSSLFNSLIAARADKQPVAPEQPAAHGAIVSHVAGTTRDYLTARLEFGGAVCTLVDTAGIGDTAGKRMESPAGQIEQESQAAALVQSQQAQVRILCIDASRPPDAWEQSQLGAHPCDEEAEDAGRQQLIVLTKIDAAESSYWGAALPCDAIATSSATGEGIGELRRRLADAVRNVVENDSAVVGSTALRSRESVRLAAASLARAREIAESRSTGGADDVIIGEELIAAELRVALDELGKVVGTIYSDDVLDRIFSRFCIGK